MKIKFTQRKFYLVVACLFIYCIYDLYIRPATITGVYQDTEFRSASIGECKNTAVLVNQYPLSHAAQKRLWKTHKKILLADFNAINNICDDIFFVADNRKNVGDKSEIEEWMGQDYMCFRGELEDNKCIPKESILFFISLDSITLDDEIIDDVKGKSLYIYFPSWTR